MVRGMIRVFTIVTNLYDQSFYNCKKLYDHSFYNCKKWYDQSFLQLFTIVKTLIIQFFTVVKTLIIQFVTIVQTLIIQFFRILYIFYNCKNSDFNCLDLKSHQPLSRDDFFPTRALPIGMENLHDGRVFTIVKNCEKIV